MSTALSTPISPDEEQQSREALAQMLWVGGIVGFFAIQAVIWAIAITLVHNDPSHAVIANLDERVSSSDTRLAVRLASQRLGWTTSVAVVPKTDTSAQQRIEIRISDQVGKPVEIEALEVFGFHRARVTERKLLQVEALEPGVWQIMEPLSRSGWWRFEGQAVAGADRHVFEITEFLQL